MKTALVIVVIMVLAVLAPIVAILFTANPSSTAITKSTTRSHVIYAGSRNSELIDFQVPYQNCSIVANVSFLNDAGFTQSGSGRLWVFNQPDGSLLFDTPPAFQISIQRTIPMGDYTLLINATLSGNVSLDC